MSKFRKAWPLATLTVLLLAGPAAATYPGANGDIAFVMEDQRGPYLTSVFKIAPGGGDPFAMTGGKGEDQAPSWSADGESLVFERRWAEGPTLHMVRADGTGERQLTHGGTSMDPAISPDGRTIAFVRVGDPGKSLRNIYTMDVDGSNLRRLTTVEDWDPSFSPDGRTIVFETRRPGGSIGVVNVDGSGERALATAEWARQPSFSPDGSKIVFSSTGARGDDIHVMNADGTGERALPGSDSSASDPVFSPDGRKIAFAGYDDGEKRLYVMNANGTDLRLLTGVGSVPLGADPDWQPLPGRDPGAACESRQVGTEAGDRLVGSTAGDLIRGLAGDDYLRGGAGDDCLYGGTGADRVAGGAGDDRLNGSLGRDSLAGGPGGDVLEGGRSSDSVRGGEGDDRLDGGPAADVVVGGPGNDSLLGGDGPDRIDARDGTSEVVRCGRGVDRAVVDLQDETRSCERVLRAAR
ncbi:MAG TPA: hypothetical protein VF520_03975 [Thermoleophilaceae bacterium]